MVEFGLSRIEIAFVIKKLSKENGFFGEVKNGGKGKGRVWGYKYVWGKVI
jgi:hypothetical protein